MTADAGCCASCEGTGLGGPGAGPETNGRCWDCRGTGHLHDGPCPLPVPLDWCTECDLPRDVVDEFEDQDGFEEQARQVWVIALSCGHSITQPLRRWHAK